MVLTVNTGLLSLLQTTAASGSSDPVLNAYYGISGNNGTGRRDPVLALTAAERNQTKEIATTARQPQVARDIAAFSTAVGKAKDPVGLLQNPAVMKVLLTANGLADRLSYPALASKTLLSNINDPKSLANKLADTRWKTVVQTYDFANKGLSILQNQKVISTLGNAYAEVAWRHSLDATTPGLSNALSFRQGAGAITSVDQILGDPTLRTVITTTLGIPQQIAFQNLPAQEKAISSKIDIAKFKDPKFVENFTRRYLIAAEAASTTSTTSGTAPNLTTLAIQVRGLII